MVKRIVSDKFSKDIAYQTALNPQYDGYERGLSNMVYNFFDKKTGLGANVNKVLA